MVRIAHFRRILKDDFFKRIKFFAEFLSARDILDARCWMLVFKQKPAG